MFLAFLFVDHAEVLSKKCVAFNEFDIIELILFFLFEMFIKAIGSFFILLH